MDMRTIKKNLTDIGEEFDSIPENLHPYLIRIQEIVDLRAKQQKEAVEILKKNSISVSGIMSEIGSSRNTAYRYNNLIVRYIENADNTLSRTNPVKILDKMKKESIEKDEQILCMLDRDIDVQELKDQIKPLEQMIAEKEKMIERYRTRVLELQASRPAK